jgi:pyruvate,water dikinase
MTAFTRRLAELGHADAAEFGGKSANLGELVAAGLPVPHGFAVGARAYRIFVEEAGLDRTIEAALRRASTGEVDDVHAASKAIDESMRFAPLPAAVRSELERRYHELERVTDELQLPVAVRSSALGEDSRDASHAGQQESFLWVRSVEHVCDAVRDCWVSLYTPHAISYRAVQHADRGEQAMGVAVQAMVDAEVSGVLFTCNPVSGDPSVVAVNASFGLGTAVVSGELTPDDYVVSKVTGEVVRRAVSTKGFEYVPDEAGRGTVRRDVPAARRDEPCLGEEELATLVDLARLVEDHFGGHQDVEWAFARGRPRAGGLHVLQARPVTTLPERTPTGSSSAMSLVMSMFGASAKPRKRS